jgi:hypothetical protein
VKIKSAARRNRDHGRLLQLRRRPPGSPRSELVGRVAFIWVSKDLIDWLRAQFDVDERVARAAQDLERDVFDGTGVIVMHAATGTRSVTLSSAVAIHIADHDPARVLREVRAYRLIIDEHVPGADVCDAHDASLRTIPCPTLLAVAAIFSDRPGYREEWRP